MTTFHPTRDTSPLPLGRGIGEGAPGPLATVSHDKSIWSVCFHAVNLQGFEAVVSRVFWDMGVISGHGDVGEILKQPGVLLEATS